MLMTSSETEANPGSKTRMGHLPLWQRRFLRSVATRI
jgi:hypothetical protein